MRKTALTLSILLLAAGNAQAQLPIADKTIQDTGKLKLNIHYPETGRADIDQIFAEAAQKYAADPDLHETSGGQNSGSMSYEIKRNDAQMFSVQVSTYSYYAGHAHGVPEMESYNFLMPEAARVQLSDLVDGRRGLTRISELAVADLMGQLKSQDPQSIRDGTSPDESSFFNFAWLPDALELTFPPYQVSGYAQGTLTVRIPLSRISDVIRADPRVPVASFDCGVARSRIEKAICSDAELARLDRRVAQKFAFRRDILRGNRDKTITWQREWLKRRDSDCAGASVACLKASYRAHLKEPAP